MFTAEAPATTATIYRYKGSGGMGAFSTMPVAEFVERRFKARWKWMTVTDDNGTTVGEITTNPDTKSLTWWAES